MYSAARAMLGYGEDAANPAVLDIKQNAIVPAAIFHVIAAPYFRQKSPR